MGQNLSNISESMQMQKICRDQNNAEIDNNQPIDEQYMTELQSKSFELNNQQQLELLQQYQQEKRQFIFKEDQLKKEIEELREQLFNQEEDFSKHHSESEKDKQIIQLNQVIKNVVDSHKVKMEELEKKIKGQKKKNQSQDSATLKKNQQLVDSLDKQMKLNQQQAEQIQKLETELDQKKYANKLLTENEKNYNDKIKSLEVEVQQANQSINDLNKQMLKLEDEQGMYFMEKVDLTNEKDQALMEKQKLEVKLNDMQQKLKDSQEALKNLENEKSMWKRQASFDVSDKNETIQILKEELKNKYETEQQMTEKIQNLEKQFEIEKSVHSMQMIEQSNKIQLIKNQFCSDNELSATQIEKLEKNIGDYKKIIEKNQSEIEQKRVKISEQTKLINNLQNQVNFLKEKIENIEQQEEEEDEDEEQEKEMQKQKEKSSSFGQSIKNQNQSATTKSDCGKSTGSNQNYYDENE